LVSLLRTISVSSAFVAVALGARAAEAQSPGGPPAPPREDARGEPAEGRILAPASRLLAEARRLREAENCARAAPTYRVVAGMGEGQEAAQHELGECLLAMTGVSVVETDLFRQEGVFWLTRAAYAGNARAQRALAVHFAPQAMGASANAEALKWALVYAKNPEAKLYGFKELPQTFIPGLSTQLGGAASQAAQSFAAAFQPLSLAKFEPPKPKKVDGKFGPPTGAAPPRERPR
jgi:TPR repeat protein